MADIIDSARQIISNPITTILNPVATGGGATTALGGKRPESPLTLPVAESPDKTLIDPMAMPTLADGRMAKRKSFAQQLARKGRASTILTNDDGLGASG